jgi:twinkle protein
VKKIEGIDFAEYLEFVGRQESQSIRQISSATTQIWDWLQQPPDAKGDPLPWPRMHKCFRLRAREVTLWAGVNGHGKSMVLSHVTAHLMLEHGPIAVASMEMPIETLGERLVRQLAGGADFDVARFGEIMAATDDRYWVYDEQESVTPERILGFVAYCAKELGCRHVVIDSLVKCGLDKGERSNKAQADFLDQLTWAAKRFGPHIHLVHHMRKGDSEDRPGGKFDVKGAGELTDQADNLVLVWRNKPKERAIEDGSETPDMLEEADTILEVAKQRHFPWEGRIWLWHDTASSQFRDDRYELPIEIVPRTPVNRRVRHF